MTHSSESPLGLFILTRILGGKAVFALGIFPHEMYLFIYI